MVAEILSVNFVLKSVGLVTTVLSFFAVAPSAQIAYSVMVCPYSLDPVISVIFNTLSVILVSPMSSPIAE